MKCLWFVASRSSWQYLQIQSAGLHCSTRSIGGHFEKKTYTKLFPHTSYESFFITCQTTNPPTCTSALSVTPPKWVDNNCGPVSHSRCPKMERGQCQSHQPTLQMTCPQQTKRRSHPGPSYCQCSPEKPHTGPLDVRKRFWTELNSDCCSTHLWFVHEVTL